MVVRRAKEARILAGIDYSNASAAVLREAHQLAGLLGATVEVVHVEDGRGGPGAPGLAGRPDDVIAPATVRTRRGIPWVELVREAEALDALLVVVGSHGASGYQPLSLGSTTARLTLQCRCPVVVVSTRNGGLRSG